MADASQSASRVPRATYRFQFNEKFRLSDALDLLPYLDSLGISHIYASPLFKARPHSGHGYDVCDFTQLNPEIGTEEELARLIAALRKRKMGLVLDIVPNHMGIGTPDNHWWWDVLTHGASSQYASYFDIDWNTNDPRLRGKVPLPILEDRYGRVLEKGVLKLQIKSGRTVLCYHDNELPLAPGSVPSNSDLERLNASMESLDELIQRQNYFLTYWKHGDSRLKYRRFFTISSLAGLRVEDERVFMQAHSLVKRWLENDWIDGLRVDHPDGLRDPMQYLTRLRHFAPNAWIVVEKILEPGEALPQAWPVAGTTGYDFLNQVNGLFVNTGAEKALTEFYAEFTGEPTNYARMVCDKKRAMLEDSFIAEVNLLVELVVDISAHYWKYRDFTREEFRQSLIELAACLPVYRTYLTPEQNAPGECDRANIEEAIEAARRRRPELAPELFDFLGQLLLLKLRGDCENEFVARFQQLSGPAMAKGVEDTAFYLFNRFIALNEVGGDPGTFGISREAFYQFCQRQQRDWPSTMLGSTTHDTKRGEGVRARLAVLSEVPQVWMDQVRRWSSMNQRHRQGDWPDRNAEYVFYQTLVGAWPLSVERAQDFMAKASSEAKQFTSWNHPNDGYRSALGEFVKKTMSDQEFMRSVENFVETILDSGFRNSLAQTLIKMTAPGVPDFYQGAELWDFSLVDPDNRRPAQFDIRKMLAEELDRMSLEAIWSRRKEGAPKLWLIRRLLNLRRDRPELFGAESEFKPLSARGPKAEHVVAYLRGGKLATIAPRLTHLLKDDWGDTTLELDGGRWNNVLTGKSFSNGANLGEMQAGFPVGLLLRED